MTVFKKSISCLLAFALCLLCGCAQQSAAPAPSPTAEPEAQAQPQSVYAADFSTLVKSVLYVGARAATDEGFYSVDYSVKAEGDEESSTGYSAAVCFVSYTGEMRRMEEYRPVTPPPELAAMPDFYSTHEIMGLTADPEGGFITVESLYMSWYAGTGQRRDEYGSAFDDHERQLFVRRFDENGAQLSCALLSLGEGENVYADDLVTDENGSIIVTGQSRLRFFAMDGSDRGSVDLGGYVRKVLRSDDGGIWAVCYGQSYGDEELLCRIDCEEKRIISSIPIPGGGMYLCPGDGEYDIYYTDGRDFCGWSFARSASHRLFSWVGLGVDVNTLSHVRRLPDGSVRAVSTHYSEAEQCFVTELVSVALREESAPGSVITLGTLEAGNELMEKIVSFNRRSADCRIELIEYFRLYDFSREGQRGRLMAELMSGNVPDVLMLDGLNLRLLAGAGVFEDLYPYIDEDPRLSREDFFPNLLEACSFQGALVAAPTAFTVDTVLADGELVGYEPGWSYAEYYEALAAMGPGCQPFEVYATSDELLRSCVGMELDSFIDWQQLTADFDNERFIAMLRYAKTLPAQFDWNSYPWSDADIVEYRIAGGRQMLLRTSLMSIEEVFYNSIYFNGNVSCIGYPSYDGSVGNALSLVQSCAVSRSCADKQAAWQFVSSLLTEEGQSEQWGFPGNRKVYDSRAAALMDASFLTDENDEPVLTEEGGQIELYQGHMGTVLGVRGFYSLTPQQADSFEKVLTGCVKLRCADEELLGLIVDSSRPFLESRQGEAAAAAAVDAAVERYLSQYK